MSVAQAAHFRVEGCAMERRSLRFESEEGFGSFWSVAWKRPLKLCIGEERK